MLERILTCALFFAGVAVCAAGAPVAPAGGEWRDLESRIQYGYYTQDSAALRSLSIGSAVSATALQQPWHGYYAGLLALRRAQLAGLAAPAGGPATSAGSPEPSALAGAQECVAALDDALSVQEGFADALALRSACLAQPLGSATRFASFSARRLRRDMARAVQLAPHNPRVLLLDALNDYNLPGSLGGNRDRALGKLRRCVAAFESERRGIEPLPGWGAAEAYLSLGRSLLDHGDSRGARDALEHALLLAPQYIQARRMLTQLIGS